MQKSGFGSLTKTFLSWGIVVGLFFVLFLIDVPNAFAVYVAPTNLYVDATSTESMTLHWTAGGGNESMYATYRSTNGTDYVIYDANATTSPDFVSYTFNNLATNTLYYLIVTAAGPGGEDAVTSSVYSGYTLAADPEIPTVGTPTATTLPITLNADTNPVNTIYAVKIVANAVTKYLQADGTIGDSAVWLTYAQLGGGAPTSTTGLTPNTSYVVSVAAKSGSEAITSYTAAPDVYTYAAQPSVPIIGTPTTTTMPIIIDVDTNPEGTEYAIYNSTSGNYLSALGVSSATPVWQTTTTWGSSFVATGLTTNTLYRFVTVARNEGLISVTSTASSATAGTIAVAPTSFTATTVGQTGINVAWLSNGNSANTTYKVTYSNGTLIGTTTNVSYSVTGLTPNTSYTFKVAALYKNDGVTYSPYSSTATATTNASHGGTSNGSSDTTPPTNTSIKINENAVSANSNQVTLTLVASGATQMMLSNTSDFAGATWEAYASSKIWLLTTGAGTKTVYVKFRDSSFNVSSAVTDSIDYLSATVVETPAVVTPVVQASVVAPATTVVSPAPVVPTVTQPTTVVIPKYTFTKFLTLGSKGTEVVKLQEKLRALGYFTYPTNTGNFGGVTKAALVKFQKDHNLKPFPGWVGPGTRASLNSL